MRFILLLSFLFITSLQAGAQKSLSTGRQTSAYTYIYKINAKETKALAASGMYKVDERYLHSLVDSFDIEEPILKPGNYLFVHAEKNQLVFELRSIGDVHYKLINNDRDLVLALHTAEGKLIDNANVFIRNKQLQYDKTTQSYRLNKYKKSGLIKVYYNDVLYLFPIESRNFSKQNIWQKASSAFPLKHIVQPIRRLINSDNYYQDYFKGTAYEKKFQGFMVFSKPIYKPGDTVRLKAFITNKKGKPLRKHLLLRLTDRRFDIDTIMATINPYRHGGYEYLFVLNEKLDLDLDDEYLLTLEALRSKKYDLDEYNGWLDDEEYALKRKVVMRGKFQYEEYELAGTNLSARTDKKEHTRNDQVSIYLKATDENDMAVMDGRIKLLVKPSDYSSKIFHAPKVFLPDTLWYHEQNLEPAGETKITLPDSIFPKASFGYSVECVFLNSNNELKTQTLAQTFSGEEKVISFILQQDSLRIEHIVGGRSVTTTAELCGYADDDAEDTVENRTITLPATIKINPFVKIYEIETDSLYEEYKVKPAKGMLSALASRTNDSIKVQLVNPYSLPVWYTLFAGNKIIHRGYGNSWSFNDKVRTAKNYFVSIQYIFAGQVSFENYTIPYQDKLLSVNVSQPEFIYPGQSATINIEVKNALGKAVPNTDIIAYAFTKKFIDARSPFVPYLGKYYKLRKRYAAFNSADEEAEFIGQIKLNWQRWSKEMKLDTIEYFKFLHPQSLYINVEPAPDSITQIAPFVVKHGELQPVHQIYIDEKPVFFSQSQHLQRYSFQVSPGKHSLRLRTHNSLIRLDSFEVKKGVKTFVSINADTANKVIRIEKMPDSLTRYEQNLWDKYMILVENNFGENFAYIQQPENLYLLNAHKQYSASLLTGPLPHRSATLVVKRKFIQDFEAEPGYAYQISKGLVKQKQFLIPYPFTSQLSNTTPAHNFRDLVLTEKEIDSLWQDYLDHRSANEDLFLLADLNKTGNGQLSIGLSREKENKTIFIKNILVFKYDDPDFVRIYKGNSKMLGYFKPGKYRLFFLLKNDDYFIKDSIVIVKNGINYYEVRIANFKRCDSVSIKIAETINNREKFSRFANTDDLNYIKESFNEKYLDTTTFTEIISGIVRDDKNHPLAGVTIMIKGTHAGTTTDTEGRFVLRTPTHAILVLNFVGFSSQEIKANPGVDHSLVMIPATNNLDEVVVTGYGVSRKSNLARSVTSISGDVLQGKVPGVIINPGSQSTIRIRGVRSISFNNTALIIVDGLAASESEIERLDQNIIEDIRVMKPEEAIALYGSRGANGVVVITTTKNKLKAAELSNEFPAPGNSLRRNFRDDAYWQPRLKTNAEGKASFNVSFPDDITNWRTFVIAITDKKQTGYAESSIKSFKALSGNLALPQFAVTGDSMHVIGKTLNYLNDSISAKRTFLVNDVLVEETVINLRNSWIDTFSVVAKNNDSLKFRYSIQKADGYFDGEERSIPVFRQGVLETSGFFAALNNDTSFSFQLHSDTGTIKIQAEASLLPVFEDEIERIRNYEYLCNEQLASKLKALLVQKRIAGFLKKDFKGEKNIRELIDKLNQNKVQAGLWGWWNNTPPAVWISLHAIEALTQAQLMGYNVSINKALLVDYLIYNLESYKGTERISSLHLLHQLNAKTDFKKYIDEIETHSDKLSLYEKLRLAELKQKLELPISLDTMIAKQSHTMFGNIYWGDEGYRFFDNSIQNTLAMYRLLKAQGGNRNLLLKTRNYFLEKRKSGHWRNTYESSLILETILPDLLVNDSVPKPASLTISGAQSYTVKTFPFAAQLKSGEQLAITKSGDMPVYFTAYEQHWNKTPEKVSGDFTVTSSFEKNGQQVTTLKAGDPVLMKINVSVKADADYVMIEVPVPAGCSYKDKNQPYYFNNEVHREYFKNKVSIFCSSLQKGNYTFTVSLLPRYTGSYHLNPAKAEMMYFPVFYGREEMKKLLIR